MVEYFSLGVKLFTPLMNVPKRLLLYSIAEVISPAGLQPGKYFTLKYF